VIDTLQKIADNPRRRRKYKDISNVEKKNILP